MKRILTLALIIAAVLLAVLSGCDHREDIGPYERIANDSTNTGKRSDTSYVEITPPWIGYTSPRAVVVGRDQLIYVADYGSNEILLVDAGGTILKRRSILHPVAIGQNSKLDLYVAGEMIAPNGVDTIAAIFRIYLVRFDTTYVARIDTISGRPVAIKRDTSFFFNHDLTLAPMRTVWKEAGKPNRRFVGIGIMPNNDYVAARVGANNTSVVDPDSRVLLFNKGDTLLTPLPELITRASGGTGINDVRFLTGVFVFPSSRDIIVTQSSEGMAYGAIWMVYSENLFFQGYLPKFDPANPDQRGVDFIRSYRYTSATAATYDSRKREIFVLDSEQDSVVKFTAKGAFKAESFGRSLTGQRQLRPLNHPMGIAFSNDCTLYIADTGNSIIRRFRLSSQTVCF